MAVKMLVGLVIASYTFATVAGINCDPPAKEDCNMGMDQSVRHPWPCDCHKYWLCINGQIMERVCDGNLIFDPVRENCVFEYQAPPGICQSSKPTTAGPTTTPQPTTQPPTTTPKECPMCAGCVCDAAHGSSDGFFQQHPDNCHWYYECVHNVDDPDCEWSTNGPFDCGDWAFNENQASCTWPNLVDPPCEDEVVPPKFF